MVVASRGTTATALERIDLAIDLFYCIPTVDAANRRVKAVVLKPSTDHVGRCRPVVIAGLAIDALAFIAAVVDAFPASAILAACAEAGVEILYSEDVPGFAIKSPKVVNPFV